MLSQISWLQFFLFVGGAAILWYVYVFFVYFGSSINKAITQPRDQAVAIPVARRPVSRSIIQTEDFSLRQPPTATTNQPLEQEPQRAPALKGESEKVAAQVPVATVPVIVPPSVLDDTPPAAKEAVEENDDDTSDTISVLDNDAIVTTDVDSDMSPAVLAALSGQSYNWADSPALNMDYREPDDKGIAEIVATPVTEETEDDKASGDTAAVPAEDYADSVGQLVKTGIEPAAKETVLSSLQNLTGNSAIADLVQRSKNVACNLTLAFEEIENRGQLSEIQVDFRNRFLKPQTTSAVVAPDAASVTIADPRTDTKAIDPTPKEDTGSTEVVTSTGTDKTDTPSDTSTTDTMDEDDYAALMESLS